MSRLGSHWSLLAPRWFLLLAGSLWQKGIGGFHAWKGPIIGTLMAKESWRQQFLGSVLHIEVSQSGIFRIHPCGYWWTCVGWRGEGSEHTHSSHYLQTRPPPRKPMLWKSHRVSQMIAQLMDLRSYRCWLWWAYWVIWGDLWILIDLDRSHWDINTEPLIPNLINKDTRWGYWETFKDFNFIIFISISLHVRIMATTSRLQWPHLVGVAKVYTLWL